MKNLSVQNVNKKKVIFLSFISVLMVAMITAGVTIAVMSKSTENRANNFTFGNVSIELTEDKWDELQEEDKIIYPNKTLPKNPVITNIGKNSLYAYMEVRVPRAEVRTVNADETVNASETRDLFTFEVNEDSGWNRIDKSVDGDYSVYLYVYTTPLSHGEETPELFDSVTFINILEGEIEMDTNIEMPVTAYAIQSEYCTGNDFKDIFDKYIES